MSGYNQDSPQAEKTTSVTYNVTAQRLLMAQEAAYAPPRGTESISGAATDMGLTQQQPKILVDIDALLVKQRAGELSIEQYTDEVKKLLAQSYDSSTTPEEIKNQIFRNPTPAALPQSDLAGHEDAHCSHVLPLLLALQAGLPVKVTQKQEINEGTQTVTRTMMQEYADGRVVCNKEVAQTTASL